MKALYFASAALTAGYTSATAAPAAELDRRQILCCAKVGHPPGAAPTTVKMAARHPNVPGSKTVKLRYGPYKVPGATKGGMVWNNPDMSVTKPCSDCMVIGLNAGLEYPDGTNANIDSGLWLHHMVAFLVGPGRSDPTCAGRMSLPHVAVMSSASGSERFFASGNERSVISLPGWNITNAGYPVRKADRLALIIDLMNQNADDKIVYLTMYYDYVEGIRKDWTEVKPVWFDVAQCAFSEVFPPKQDGQFTITASPWLSTVNGQVYGLGGHVHDGGTNVRIEVDGKQICNSVASYGSKPEFVQKVVPAGGHSHGGATEHLSAMTMCTKGGGLGLTDIKKGQRWVLKADYDYNKFKGMTNKSGKQDTIMGIAIMYVGLKR